MNLHFTTSNKMQKCQDIANDKRYSTSLQLNSVINPILGKPLFPSSITIVTGESGTGKTTLLLQSCSKHAMVHRKVGYISGEQNIAFLKKICDNCNIRDVDLGNITDMDEIKSIIPSYNVLVIDSFPCITCSDKYNIKTASKREQFILEQLATTAQKCNCALIIILHATKTGQYKGSTFFKHVVDNMIILKRGDSIGNVNINLEKSRLSEPANIVLHMSSQGFVELYNKTPAELHEEQRQLAKEQQRQRSIKLMKESQYKANLTMLDKAIEGYHRLHSSGLSEKEYTRQVVYKETFDIIYDYIVGNIKPQDFELKLYISVRNAWQSSRAYNMQDDYRKYFDGVVKALQENGCKNIDLKTYKPTK